MPNANFQDDHVNGSVPTAAAESIDEPMTTSEMEDDYDEPEMGLYDVSLSCRLSLSACVTVYAADEDEAERKVQNKINAQSLDDDLEVENYESGHRIRFRDVKAFFEYGSNEFRIQNVEGSIEDFDPVGMLEAQVEELQASISWNTDTLAKHKAFLESLLNDDGEEQAVTA